MFIHALVCEMCNKQVKIDPLAMPDFLQMPKEWLILSCNSLEKLQRHFCSERCLRSWLALSLEEDGRPRLSDEQMKSVDEIRDTLHKHALAKMETFHKQYPELRLEWYFTIDILSREKTL